jgi:hypothetical protein
MRIDVHAHYWTEEYLDLLIDLGKADAGQARGIGAGGGADLEVRLRLMDGAGIQMQVLSACPQSPYGEDADQATKAARFVNDQYAELVERHSDRFAAFAAFAALPMPHISALARSSSLSPARTYSACPVWRSRTSVCSMRDRIDVVQVCTPTSAAASFSAPRNAASASCGRPRASSRTARA